MTTWIRYEDLSAAHLRDALDALATLDAALRAEHWDAANGAETRLWGAMCGGCDDVQPDTGTADDVAYVSRVIAFKLGDMRFAADVQDALDDMENSGAEDDETLGVYLACTRLDELRDDLQAALDDKRGEAPSGIGGALASFAALCLFIGAIVAACAVMSG